jgi:tetratricopeptide (TPR) repeat protein
MTRHVSALLEDNAGYIGEDERRVILTSLEHAGDPRLVPTLRGVLIAESAALYEPCVRALAGIEDPRVPGLLRDAFERATRASARLVLAGALGRYGDTRGLEYARAVLIERDPELLSAALEALADVGGTDDVQRVADLLEGQSPAVVLRAVAALGRIGDARALVPLAELRSREHPSALQAAIEEAEAAIVARAELLGEAAPSREALGLSWDTRRMVVSARERDPALLRARSRLYFGLAYLCLLFGARRRGTALFEAAAALRPGWLAPVRALALLHARLRDVAAALSAFRRALDIDRAAVESDEHAISVLATTFLRRAEDVEREGRVVVARGLVEEALSYDLRRASAQARLALTERRAAHSARERG